MDILRTIKTRRSIRKFQERKVPRKFLRMILEGGRWAPSGLNNQPWGFLLIEEKEKLRELARFTLCGEIIRAAPAVICVFLNTGESYDRDKDLMAVGAAVENMLLTISSLGLGGCWLGEILKRKKQAEKFLKIPGIFELAAVIALGYPEEKPRGQRKSLRQIVIK